MTQAVKLREKLVNKLSDLFQLNQPDLDFGFYRIMHAKAAQVQQFIDQDLLTIVSDAFGQAAEVDHVLMRLVRGVVEHEMRLDDMLVPEGDHVGRSLVQCVVPVIRRNITHDHIVPLVRENDTQADAVYLSALRQRRCEAA